MLREVTNQQIDDGSVHAPIFKMAMKRLQPADIGLSSPSNAALHAFVQIYGCSN
jgi:hypothetical protein